jgi:hypothetical protein
MMRGRSRSRRPTTLAYKKALAGHKGVPWCEACKSWHARPRDKEHHAALKCFAPWVEEGAAR